MRHMMWLAAFLPMSLHASAAEVFVKEGNVYFKAGQASAVQMTESGRDSEPVLSPDGNSIAFVRDTPGVTVSTGAGDANATELWLLDIASKKAELLTRGKESREAEHTIAEMRVLTFSLDGRSIYFVSDAWAVSPSVQNISLDTKKVRFISDGGLEGIVASGKYRGYVLVGRALIKFDKNGDSLGRDIYLWLVSPGGKQIREIGQDDSAAATRFRKSALAAQAGQKAE